MPGRHAHVLAPTTGEPAAAERQRLTLDLDLPMRDAFSDMIRALIP